MWNKTHSPHRRYFCIPSANRDWAGVLDLELQALMDFAGLDSTRYSLGGMFYSNFFL